ncbi:hypothetical protein, partial [Mycobacterium avium]|uniref:hypothetical protein n=1 Tax=Mycobacterium avium TaxID=1764 RepID=UPI001F37CD66
HARTHRLTHRITQHYTTSRDLTATAVTIASWWQSPGGIGKALAAFASGSPVSRQELLDDIAATRTEHGYHTLAMLPRDRHALDCLSTFVLRHC